jgi:hypothetical protein
MGDVTSGEGGCGEKLTSRNRRKQGFESTPRKIVMHQSSGLLQIDRRTNSEVRERLRSAD